MLPKSQRIHTDSDFKKMRTRGRKWQSASFIALSLPAKYAEARFGVIVSSKIGKAVIRKRASRILRAAYAETRSLATGQDLVLIARPYIKHKTSQQIAGEMRRMFKGGRE
jgi:ribonuclease P protein component